MTPDKNKNKDTQPGFSETTKQEQIKDHPEAKTGKKRYSPAMEAALDAVENMGKKTKH